jgi:hypothetical protein
MVAMICHKNPRRYATEYVAILTAEQRAGFSRFHELKANAISLAACH